MTFTSAAPVEDKMGILAIRSASETVSAGRMLLRGYQRYFADRIEKDSEFKRRVLALKGKRLGMLLQAQRCHGDVIADWLNKMEPKA